MALGRDHSLRHPAECRPDCDPVVGFQHHKGNLSLGQVLLISDILIARDHDVVACQLGGRDQLAVAKPGPTSFSRSMNLEALKILPNTNRNAFIKQNAADRPSCWRSRLSGAHDRAEG